MRRIMNVLLAATFSAVATAPLAAADQEPDWQGLLSARPLELSLGNLYAPQGEFGESYAPAGYFSPPLRFDMLFGSFIPFEDSGMAFGASTADEDFDVGGGFGFRIQARLNKVLSIGGQIDFQFHDVNPGEVFFDGQMTRFFFMVPVTLDLPLGSGRRPATLGLTVAPGVQVVSPDVSHFVEDREAFLGRFIDQDDFAGFSLRIGATLRVPLSPFGHFFIDAAYDWAVGRADVAVRNSFGTVIEDRSDDVDLSGLSIMVGWAFLF